MSSSISDTMKAIVIRKPGGPEVLQVETLPLPKPSTGQVLLRIRAFGLNRAELYARQGKFPGKLPRVLGYEAVGTVEDAPGNEFKRGDVVITALGGMSQEFDGGYAEFTRLPASQVVFVQSQTDGEVDWALLGAMPVMYETAYGALHRSLKLQKSDRLLIRGGTSSVGLAAASIAKNHFGVQVIGATSRKGDQQTVDLLKGSGVTETYVEDGALALKLSEKYDKVLEFVGATSLLDSLQCVKEGGIVCFAGILGNGYQLDGAFSPMEAIPTSVCLTTYGGGFADLKAAPFKEFWEKAKEGSLKVPIGKVFQGLESIVEAHQAMDDSTARGKIVVVV